MRELKFRAWDKRFKKMDFGSGALLLRINSDDFSEPMQYTGLKDKDGREIYEGDLIKIDEGWCGDFSYKSCVAEVRYGDGNFYAYDGKDEHGVVWQEFSWERNTKVIGNIHENPELVEVK